MPLITLTTDWGTTDFYSGAFKGILLDKCPDVRIVDITHQIPPFDILRASFVLRNCYKAFPKGTIHIVDVSKYDYQQPAQLPIVISAEGFIFIGRNNGLFPITLNTKPDGVFSIQEKNGENVSIAVLLAETAARIVNGEEPKQMGEPVEWFLRKVIQPITDQNSIHGNVIYVDAYGNVITNITEDIFKEVGKGRNFIIYFKRPGYYDIDHISHHYSDVEPPERLALFNTAGFLEIALNEAKASTLMGLKINDSIIVQFAS
ncbi:MAG: SAM-dependent chlorinase/fluorinase [Bacteroidota bacterium]